ncbi:MAG: DUF1304 domain-containing protein [Chloroflexota bacterium]
MPLIAQMFAVIAAILHIWFFVLESILWRRPSTWRRFRLESQEAADLIAPMARNQGFYNLFLALGVLFGVLTAYGENDFFHLGDGGSGEAVALFGCLVMVGAGIVLVLGDRRFLSAALIQAVPPALAIVAVVVLPG